MATTPSTRAATAGGPAGPRERRSADRRGPPLALAAIVAAVWAAVVSYGLVLGLAAVGAIGSGGTPAGVMRLSLTAWLLGHAVPSETPSDRITLVPLALSAFAAWRLVRAGVHASRAVGAHRDRSPARAVGAAAAVAVAYAAVGALAAALAGTANVSVSVWRAAATVGLFALVAAALGGLRHSRGGRGLLRRTPVVMRDAARTGVLASVLVLAAGALVAGIALAVNGGDAARMLGSYRAGVLGQAGITLLCLAYAPNIAVWSAAYMLGPGFSVGVDTVVSPGELLLGPLPAVPLLAGLPSTPAGSYAPALLAVPVAAAMWAGWLLARRDPDGAAAPTWGALLGRAALAGPVAGLVLQATGWLSAGALGSGRLAVIGPTGWQLGLMATVVITLGAMLGAAAARTLSHRS